MYVGMYVCIYIYIYIHIHTHTHTDCIGFRMGGYKLLKFGVFGILPQGFKYLGRGNF